MRHFKVYLDRKIAGVAIEYETVEVEDTATEAEIEAACQDVLDVMIGNSTDSGWYELTGDEE